MLRVLAIVLRGGLEVASLISVTMILLFKLVHLNLSH